MSIRGSKAGIRRKLVALLVLAGVAPLAIFGAAAVTSAHSVADDMARNANRAIAERAAQAIGLHLDGVLQSLAAGADALGRAHLTPAQEEQILLGLRRHVRAYARLTQVDRSGAILHDTGAARSALDLTDPALAAALAGRFYVGPLVLDSLVPMVRAAAPVTTLGRVDGALVAELDLVAIWSVVDGFQVGSTGRALVLDETGRLVAHGDPRAKALIPRHEPMTGLLVLAHDAAAHGGMAEGRGSLGTEVTAVVAAVPGTAWTLILEQDVRETFAEARGLAWLLAGLAAAAVVIAVAVGARLARRSLIAPLGKLEEAAEAFARRRFDHRVELATGDELESFGRTLNDMAAALARAYEDLARTERAEAFGMIAAGLAHDLKHPVGDLQTVLLRARGKGGPDIDRLLAESARRAVPKLTGMVEQLRDLGRAGRRHDTELPANALLEVLDGFRASADEKGVTLEGRPCEATIVADGNLLTRAIENLLSNALDATPPGGLVTLALVVAPPTTLEIRVRDTGPGIPPGAHAAALRPFSPTAEGLGLGLHVVRRVAEAHGGELRIGALPAGGSEIVLALPVVREASDGDRRVADGDPREPTAPEAAQRASDPAPHRAADGG